MSDETDHRRKKQGIKTFHLKESTNNGSWGPTSQIPGLSHSVAPGPPERTSGRRVGIFETDSDYVKLAKQGGQKGLLWHEEASEVTKSGTQYKPPDWFFSNEEECSTQGTSAIFIAPEESKISLTKGTFQPLTAPFGGDDKSAWEREDDSVSSGSEKISKVNQEMGKMSVTCDDDHQANKFKKTSFEKSRVPVSMSKLLSFGYAEDETKSPKDDDASSATSEPTDSTTVEENEGPSGSE